MVVNKDVRVGVIKPVTDSDIVCSIESTKSNRHVGHSECAHLIELMLQNTEHLSSYHKSQGVALLQEFEDVIAKSDDDLGQTSLSFHTIDTEDNQPIRQHARRLPFHQHKEVSELVNSMLSRGIIESSDSPWASPVVLVRKKMGRQGGVWTFVNLMTAHERMPSCPELMNHWMLWVVHVFSQLLIWPVGIGKW